MQKFKEELSGDELNDLIIDLGAAAAVLDMHRKFNKPFTAFIKAFLRRKNCPYPEVHVEGVISASWIELQKDFVKYSKREKKSDYTSPYGFLLAVGLNLAKKHLGEDIKQDRSIISLVSDREIFNDEIDYFVYNNGNFDVFREINKNSPEARLQTKELLECINTCIQHHQFSQIQQAAFSLYYCEHYSHKEIGELLRIAETTSRAHVSRIVKKIRPEIKRIFGGLK